MIAFIIRFVFVIIFVGLLYLLAVSCMGLISSFAVPFNFSNTTVTVLKSFLAAFFLGVIVLFILNLFRKFRE